MRHPYPHRLPLVLAIVLGIGWFHVTLARVSYYDILGVSKTANEKEIQRAYRKQALKHHPDKGGDEEKFKELSKAYECLSDPGKRQIYDSYGEAGVENGGGGGSGFPFGASGGTTPFSTFFSNNGSGGSTGFRTETFSFGGRNNGSDDIDISEILKQMFMGAGAGAGGVGSSGNNYDTTASFFSPGSSTRNGSSRRHRTSSQPTSATFTQPVYCTLEDLATGRTKKMKVKFRGNEKIFEIVLKPGWKEGTKITYRASTDFPTTMVFQVHESPHPYLRRQGNDLHYTCWISESQTHGGIQLKVPLPTGDVWTKHIPKDGKKEVVPHGKSLIVPSMGMPIKGGPERGDLIIDFRVRRSSTSVS